MNTLGMTKRAHKTLKMLAKGKLPTYPGLYVWCHIGGGEITPIGYGKTLEYAQRLSESKYPKKYRLYKLVRVARKEKDEI